MAVVPVTRAQVETHQTAVLFFYIEIVSPVSPTRLVVIPAFEIKEHSKISSGVRMKKRISPVSPMSPWLSQSPYSLDTPTSSIEQRLATWDPEIPVIRPALPSLDTTSSRRRRSGAPSPQLVSRELSAYSGSELDAQTFESECFSPMDLCATSSASPTGRKDHLSFSTENQRFLETIKAETKHDSSKRRSTCISLRINTKPKSPESTLPPWRRRWSGRREQRPDPTAAFPTQNIDCVRPHVESQIPDPRTRTRTSITSRSEQNSRSGSVATEHVYGHGTSDSRRHPPSHHDQRSTTKRPSTIPSTQPAPQSERQKPHHNHPLLLTSLTHLRTTLVPLISVTTGLPHPEFPTSLLQYHLLTHHQLDSLARWYHQTLDAGPERTLYPAMIERTWVRTLPTSDTSGLEVVDLENKRRRFGRFIGLRGCQSPVLASLLSSASFSSEDEKEEEKESLNEKMEREWRAALQRAEEEKMLAEKSWRGRF